MSAIDKYFYDPTFPLYHYTSISALEGIASNRTVWASHIYYLNDSAELIHAREVLREMLETKILIDGAENSQNDFAICFEDWLRNLFSSKPHNIFVFSMSQEQSLLSQWRSYTPHGKGVSVAFTPSRVATIATTNEFRLGQCIYDTASHHALLGALIVELRSRFECAEPATSENYNIHFEKYVSDILQVLSLIKHKAFEEEKEWRLISSLLPDASQKIDFRQGEGAAMLVPYTKLELGNDDWIFDNVTVGPTPHEALASSALLGFLHKHKVCRAVGSGNLPFRKW
ncbi:DUF2971 domain-containing protein [Rugamonas sp. DEMB1]|uniref:DUF2971 domain-containing protein n=1 Tax=Rugamonas sp. DEMB1 TaxID=3039386 RepID=UPI0024480000|nr:DUF2971 domain-containing protein [Rugamonas sp. DEMB1]WGG48884.1 DUF2971 domain-containing protein [Rugamonas sp. DEMB1]